MESAEECVTTHLPKRAAPKMDGAQVSEAPLQSTVAVAVPAEHRRVERARESAAPVGGDPGWSVSRRRSWL